MFVRYTLLMMLYEEAKWRHTNSNGRRSGISPLAVAFEKKAVESLGDYVAGGVLDFNWDVMQQYLDQLGKGDQPYKRHKAHYDRMRAAIPSKKKARKH